MIKSPIQLAVDACGGQKQLAEKVGVSPSFVHQWVHGDRPVPAARCIAIEAACNSEVTRHDLRPDVFGEVAAA